MPLTPTALRLDLKCGRGSISQGERCTKGAAATRPSSKNGARSGLAIAGGAGLGGAIAAAPDLFLDKRSIRSPQVKGSFVRGALAGGALTAGVLLLHKRGKIKRQKEENENYAHEKALEALDKRKNIPEDKFFDFYDREIEKALKDPNRPHPQVGGLDNIYRVPVSAASKRRDSIWASGFEPRFDKKCGNSAIPDNRQCRIGAARSPEGGSRIRRGFENAAIIGGTAAQLGGYALGVRNVFKGNVTGANRAFQAGSIGNIARGFGEIAKGRRTGNKEMEVTGRQNLATGIGISLLQEGLAGPDDGLYRSTARRVSQAVSSRIRRMNYQRRSGPPRHVGTLPSRTSAWGGSLPLNLRRGGGNRGPQSAYWA